LSFCLGVQQARDHWGLFVRPIRIVVKLWVKKEGFEEFQEFEDSAFAIMHRHRGRVCEVSKNHASLGAEPHEVHVLEFPDEQAFEAYRTDKDLLSMAPLRAECIEKTDIVIVTDGDT